MILSSKQPLSQKFAFFKHSFIKAYDRHLFCKHQYCLKFLVVFLFFAATFLNMLSFDFFYDVIYVFLSNLKSQSMILSCQLRVLEWIQNVKELLVRNRRNIWSLSDCNGTRTKNHLVRKWTLNHLAKPASLAKWLSVRLRTKWLWVRASAQSLKVNGYFLDVVLMV